MAQPLDTAVLSRILRSAQFCAFTGYLSINSGLLVMSASGKTPTDQLALNRRKTVVFTKILNNLSNSTPSLSHNAHAFIHLMALGQNWCNCIKCCLVRKNCTANHFSSTKVDEDCFILVQRKFIKIAPILCGSGLALVIEMTNTYMVQSFVQGVSKIPNNWTNSI